jgi:hypothetical protein
MKTMVEVAGPPPENLTVTVVKESSGNAGEYDFLHHRLVLSSLQLSVLAHEINHATRDKWLLSNRVWEEGLARAGEKEVMRLLALQGISESGYDTNRSYSYDEYYDQDNVPAVGVPNGHIYAEPALVFLRYEQAGYAFGKILIEDPEFIGQFNARLFTQPSGALGQPELVAMEAEVQAVVEDRPLAKWVRQQHIFDTDQKAGCYAFERASQFTVDVYCTDQDGVVATQNGTSASLKILAPTKQVVFREDAITSELGWADFEPDLSAVTGRIKTIASAKSPVGSVKKSTVYRQSGTEEGVFGVVTNAEAGVVSFSSPTGQFAPFGWRYLMVRSWRRPSVA